MVQDPLVLAGRTFESRLIVGTGKYKDVAETERAIDASGAEIVTVALRRVDLGDRSSGSLMALLARKKWLILPNTAGCYTADEAVRTLRLARELGIAPPPTPAHAGPMVKLEVIGDAQDPVPGQRADAGGRQGSSSRRASSSCPYCYDDPILCKKLEDVGCAAVMPLAAPIGSGLGIRNPQNLEIILEQATVPVIVDAGVGHRQRRGDRHGARLPWGAHEHGDRARARSGADGGGDARGRARGSQGVPRRANASAPLRATRRARPRGW